MGSLMGPPTIYSVPHGVPYGSPYYLVSLMVPYGSPSHAHTHLPYYSVSHDPSLYPIIFTMSLSVPLSI